MTYLSPQEAHDLRRLDDAEDHREWGHLDPAADVEIDAALDREQRWLGW